MKKAKPYKIIEPHNKYLEDIGGQIKEYRQRKSLTQEELGAMLGVQKAQVSKMENGSNLTMETVSKAFEVLGSKVGIRIEPKVYSIPENKKIEYIIACISDFAKVHCLSPKQSYMYLNRFGGIDFLDDFYDVEHLLSIEDAVNDVAMICRKNGGKE